MVGNFHVVQTFAFFTGMLFNAKTETAKISTSELLHLKIALYQKTAEQTLVDLCLLLALLQNGQSMHLVSTKNKQRRCASLFSFEGNIGLH